MDTLTSATIKNMEPRRRERPTGMNQNTSCHALPSSGDTKQLRVSTKKNRKGQPTGGEGENKEGRRKGAK